LPAPLRLLCRLTGDRAARRQTGTEVSPLVVAADVAAAWGGLTQGAQRAVLQALVTITVKPARSGFRPDARQRVTFGPAPSLPAA
jgi:hypothetical protein